MRPGFALMRSSGSDFAIVRVGILALLLVVLGLGLLYAYRSQTPSIPQVSITQAVQDITAGRVSAVTIAGNRATLEFRDAPSHKEQTMLAEPDTVLAKAVSDYNAANPSRAVALTYQQESQPIGVAGSILLSLLPVLLIGGFFAYLMMRARRRS
jgi:ATP-dependent Zn protease